MLRKGAEEMKKRYLVLAVIAILLVFPAAGSAKKKDEYRATPNLSFPLIATDVIQLFYRQTWVDSDLDGVVDESEWVLLLSGSAMLSIEKEAGIEQVELMPGDHLLLPARQRHRVESTSQAEKTIWLAVYFSPAR